MKKNKITKPTWIIHAVFDENAMAFHTHGLDKYGSLELELNLPLDQKQGMTFVNLVGLEIANGKKFKDGDIDNTVFQCNITFREAKSIFGENEKILRIILPDENFKFPWEDGCSQPYKSQI